MAPKDPYALTVGDLDNLHAGWSRTPTEQLDALLERRPERWRGRFNTTAAKAAACRKFAQELKQDLDEWSRDRQEIERLLKLPPRAHLAVIRAFKDLTVGFSEDDFRRERRRAAAHHSRVKKLASTLGQQHSTLGERANKRGDRNLAFLHGLHAGRLAVELRDLNTEFTDLDALALRALEEKRDRSRFRSLAPTLFSDTYSTRTAWFELRIERLAASQMFFPFRFCRWLPISELRDLRSQWHAGSTAHALLPRVEAHIKWPSLLAGLANSAAKLRDVLSPMRSVAFAELATLWHGGLHLATATLAVTQVEGVLWDLADRLNSRGIRIYRGDGDARRAYKWSFQADDYERKRHGRAVAETQLNSARALLQHTRLGALIHPQLHSFLMSEHFQDRCHYAHGRASARDTRADAVMALLCLQTTLGQIEKIEENPT